MAARLVACTLLGALAPAAAQQYAFHGYGQPDGLSNLSVTCLVQDRAGYLWVCTENGLYRFDGRDFQRFGERAGLLDTAVHSVMVDPAGRLWAATSHDLYLYDGQRFSPVRPGGHALSIAAGSRIATLSANHILVIDRDALVELSAFSDGQSWSSRPYFDPQQLQATPALAHLTSLYVDRRGRVWVGCGVQICLSSKGQVRSWGVTEGVIQDQWLSWALDAQGRLWVRGLKHVLAHDDAAARFIEQDPPHAQLTSNILFVPLVDDGHGSIFTRTAQGIARWRAHHWEELTLENGLPTAHVSTFLSTRDGTLWLGTSGSGLWRWLGNGTFESWTVRHGGDRNPVWAVIRGADQTITMGTRAGCLHLDARSQRAVPCDIEGMTAGEIQVMARDDHGNLWIGEATGALYRVAAGQRHANLVATVPLMRKLFVDSDGRLWICSSTGLLVVQKGSPRPTPVRLPEGVGEVTDIAQAGGDLWIATQGGLLQLQNGSWNLVKLPLAAPNGFSSIVAAGKGWFWAGGASHGLLRLHVSNGSVDFAQWQTALNLTDLAVYFLQIDPRGWLWVGTDAGILVQDAGVWRKFDQEDGLIWNDTDQNSIYTDADGSLWIGTSGGLAHILKPERLINTAPLNLSISKLTVGNRQPSATAERRIPWQPNLSLNVQLQQLDFGAADKVRLQVRLRGLSDDWFQTREFSVHYPALAPGHYTFEAVAQDLDHHRTSATVQEDFEILPPWWQTTAFRILATLLLAGAVAAIWKWSVARLQLRRRALERQLAEHAALLERATRDPLTRLWNRQAILEILAKDVTTAQADGTPLAIALIDIDHFKRVNDTMGHQMGDRVLHTIAQHLATRIRAGSSLGRYGGEEMLLVLPGTALRAPFLPVERLRRTIAEIAFDDNGKPFHVTASFGVAWLKPGADTSEALIGRADAALYLAKGQGRDRVEYAAAGT